MHADALQGCVIRTVQRVWERIGTNEGCGCKGEAASEPEGKICRPGKQFCVYTLFVIYWFFDLFLFWFWLDSVSCSCYFLFVLLILLLIWFCFLFFYLFILNFFFLVHPVGTPVFVPAGYEPTYFFAEVSTIAEGIQFFQVSEPCAIYSMIIGCSTGLRPCMKIGNGKPPSFPYLVNYVFSNSIL